MSCCCMKKKEKIQASSDDSDEQNVYEEAVMTRYILNPYLKREQEGAAEVTDAWVLEKARKVFCQIIRSRSDEDCEWSTERGPYTGLSGVALSCLYMRRINGPEGVDMAFELLRRLSQQVHQSKHRRCSFVDGYLGTLVVKIECERYEEEERSSMIREVECLADYVATIDICDEVLYGRAGYLLAVLWIRRQNPNYIDDSAVKKVINAIINSGIRYSKNKGSPSPLMYAWHDSEYLGAAHGLAGILFAVLQFNNLLSIEQRNLIKLSADWLVAQQDDTGNFPSSTKYLNSIREEPLIHWCHGAPGTIPLLLLLYKIFGEEKYKNAAVRAGDLIWQYGILKKGPGLCHGVSGNGFALLQLWQVLREQKWLDRAKAFASLMMNHGIRSQQRNPDAPYSLFEGWAGALTLLCALHSSNLHNAEFPLFPMCL